ncbi:unnamed protein product, partial [Amoebophrya sp. A120]
FDVSQGSLGGTELLEELLPGRISEGKKADYLNQWQTMDGSRSGGNDKWSIQEITMAVRQPPGVNGPG